MDEVTKGGFRLTLCWNCAHATHPDVCPWVERFEPVPGWKAEKTYLMQDTPSPYESYLVVECPLFERDGYFGGMKRRRMPRPNLVTMRFVGFWKPPIGLPLKPTPRTA